MGKIRTFLLGGIIGAGLALAFAPHSGEKTRAIVAEKANAFAEEAKDFGAGLPDSAQDAYKNALAKGEALLKGTQDKTGDLVSGAQSKVMEATGKASETDADELREKIEAARQRIAAQVMENAEKAKEAAGDVTEAAAEKVEETAENVADKAEEAKHAAK